MCKRLSVLISFVLLLGLAGNALGQPTGELLFEHWMNIGGTAVADLTGDPRYPDNPDDSELRPSFEAAVDWADNYGTRARGYLYPPEDGDYTFWISGDDFIELYLSTDADPANAVMIAEVPGWTSHLEWNKYPEQQSAPITLVGGQQYYIEGIVKEAGGGDSMTAGWTGPGIGTDLTIIDGAYLSPADWAPGALKAKPVVPADGAVDVDVTALEWAAGKTAVSHTVYLSMDETIDDADLLGTTDLTLQIAVLDTGAAYYWRVDETDADGSVVVGDVWSFTTIPLEAHFPMPEDGARSQALDSQLSWTAGKVVIMHDLYFGTDEAAIAARDMTTFKGKLMDTSYDPGPLDPETTYYWAVDQFTPTGTVAGPVWSFSTIGSVPITDPDLMVYYSFEAGEGSVVIDQSGHSNHGQIMGDAQWVTGILGGAMEFDGDGDYVDSGYTEDLATYTIACWVKSPAAPSGDAPSGPLHREKNYQFNWNHSNETYQGAAAMNVGDWPAAKYGPVEADTWYHLTATFDGTSFNAYRDGVLITAVEVSAGPVPETGSMKIGRHATSAGNFFTGTVDEARVYSVAITDAEILALAKPHIMDVTAPGDVVKGVPDEPRDGSVAGWPDGEYPWMATDDDVSTKFLHFRGEVSPTGFVVEPAMGATVVTGLTLTTANDAIERDPASYEISGSNESIDGPYEVIAAGDLVDFVQEVAWPRFTMNATPISFANTTAYKYYQVMFPTVRDAGSANSMQIAEVELLGVAAPVGHWKLDGDALDASGNGNDGILMGDPQFAAGMVGDAIDLDGVDDFVDLGSDPLLDITGDITVASWIKVDVFDKSWQAIVTHGDNSWRVHRSGGSDNIAWGTSGLSPTDITGTTNVNDGEWHHVAGVYNGSQKLLYVDGAVDASSDSTGNINSSTFNVNIGENNDAQGRYFDGLIDDVRIYNKGIHALQVRDLMSPPAAAELVGAFAFGSRALDCATYNDPAVNYTMVLHDSVASVQYDAARGYGYEVIYPVDSPFGDRGGYGVLGPFDDSPNNRGEFSDECPEQLYDSFIGAKNFSAEVSAVTMGDMDTPSPNPEGIIFRVDVPNGMYRFVAAVGEADNGHAHRVVAEDGGSGPPEAIGANSVVLVHNHDQSQYDLQPDLDEPGDGVFARVGFDGMIPPMGDGVAPDPVFVDMDENGMATDAGANSPVLEVTQGYIRIHQLQGNSNDSPANTKDVNGGDIVILELWKI